MAKFKIDKNLLFIGLALLMAVGAAFLAMNYVQEQVAERTRDDREMASVAVPNADMAIGAIVQTSDLSVREVPADLVPADAVTPGNHEEYVGRMLRAPIRRGVPLSASALVPLYDQFSKVIPKGKVAYTLSVDENNSISGMIAPGDNIDILFMKDGGDEAATPGRKPGARVFPLLAQVKVLATGTRVGETVAPEGGDAEGAAGFSSITLELDQHQAKRLAVAAKVGALRVLLREISDHSPASADSLSERELLRALGDGNEGPMPGSAVEFIIGGRG